MSSLKITNVRTFITQPGTQRLIVVRVETSEPGLYGLGCATFTQRHLAVKQTLDSHIGPYVIGKDPADIQDLWLGMMHNGYWRNGPVLNNAVSGIDMALWDIKGKLAGMPCYQLWGGKTRPAAAVYTHANGRTLEGLEENVRERLAEGYRYIRCQLNGYSTGKDPLHRPDDAPAGQYFDPRKKLREIPEMFRYLRKQLGDEVELCYDVHERLAPSDAVQLAGDLQPYRLFFLEDPLAPEDSDWLRRIRATSTTPIAMGELFNNPREITPLIADRLIDFIRVHISQIGGTTPALKLARLCEAFGVRTAWHGPPDLSMIGMAAQLHLDLAGPNFGIQEWTRRSQAERDVFPNAPEVRDGYAYLNDAPGLGVDFDESAAAKHPCTDANPTWTETRGPDGGRLRP
ncbi:MAG: enolase C-terminal domain-like protein [Phycisphaerae bacterium]